MLVVKYRRKVFSDEISNFAKDTFMRIGAFHNITLEQWNHDKDHVHIMFRARPNTEMSKFINAYKSTSSRLIKKNFHTIVICGGKKCFSLEVFACLQLAELQLRLLKDISKSRAKIMNRAYKFHIYPNKEQRIMFAKTFG